MSKIKKYTFKINIHIANLIAVIFIIALFLIINMIEERVSNYLLLVFGAVAAFNFVNSIVTFYEFKEDRLILKSLIKKTIINLNEIEYIVNQPAGKFVSLSIGIYAKDKKISITSWTNNYMELMGLVVKKCQNTSGVSIDPRVFEVIKK